MCWRSDGHQPSRVRGDVFGEGPQNAGDHGALLNREVAAVTVGHDAEVLLDASQVDIGAFACADAVERGGDLHGAELARRALPAGLDVEKARESGGHFDHAGTVVVDDEPAGAESGPGRLHRFVAERRFEIGTGEHRVGDPGEDGLDRSSFVGTSTEVEEGAQRGAHRHLHHCGVLDVADNSAQKRPRRLFGAGLAERVGTVSEDPSGMGERLGVVDQRGVCFVATPVACFGLVGLPTKLAGGREEPVQIWGQPSR